jgi:hypothetical protein
LVRGRIARSRCIATVTARRLLLALAAATLLALPAALYLPRLTPPPASAPIPPDVRDVRHGPPGPDPLVPSAASSFAPPVARFVEPAVPFDFGLPPRIESRWFPHGVDTPVGSLTLFWFDASDDRLVAERVPSDHDDPAAALTAAVHALAAGRGAGVSEVPRGTRVLSVHRDDRGIWLVDVSEHVVSGGGSASMIGRTRQLHATLTSIPGVDAVGLTLGGEPITIWGGEGLMTPWPWRRSW